MELTVVRQQLLAPLGLLGRRLLLLIIVGLAALVAVGLLALGPGDPSVEPILVAPVRWVVRA